MTSPRLPLSPHAFKPDPEPVEVKIYHGRRIERQHLAKDQSTHNGDAEGTPELGPYPMADCQREGAQKSSHGRHHDRSEPQETCLEDRLLRALPLFALRLDREIDHQDAVFFHNAD